MARIVWYEQIEENVRWLRYAKAGDYYSSNVDAHDPAAQSKESELDAVAGISTVKVPAGCMVCCNLWRGA